MRQKVNQHAQFPARGRFERHRFQGKMIGAPSLRRVSPENGVADRGWAPEKINGLVAVTALTVFGTKLPQREISCQTGALLKGRPGGDSDPARKTGFGALLGSVLTKRSEIFRELGRLGRAASRAFSSPDGRWTLVSTTMTASVAFAITWLSLAATPASTSRAYEPRREQAALPYDLLLRLTGLHALPAIAAE